MQQDLTQGSITGKLVGMAGFIGIGLVFQTLYFIIDLYFVAGLGAAAGPAIWLSLQPWARLEHIWWLSATSVAIHCLVALWFLRDQLKLKLAGLTPLGAVG